MTTLSSVGWRSHVYLERPLQPIAMSFEKVRIKSFSPFPLAQVLEISPLTTPISKHDSTFNDVEISDDRNKITILWC